MLYSFSSVWAKRLEEDMFTIYVDDVLSRSRWSLENEGYDITGDDFVDSKRRGMTTRSIVPVVDGTGHIVGIIDYYVMGLAIGFDSIEDIESIVTTIGNYLIEWNDYLETMINIDVTPYVDFLAKLSGLQDWLFSYLPDDSFMKAEKEVKKQAPIGLRRPFQASTSSEPTPFIRPTYEETFGSITKTVRDRVVRDRND